MKLIQRLSDKIEEEIHDAECYAKMAIELKDTEPEISRTLYQISVEEMDHMVRLHKAAAAVIADYREKHGDPPAAMQILYDILHKKHIEAASAAKAIQALYKEV